MFKLFIYVFKLFICVQAFYIYIQAFYIYVQALYYMFKLLHYIWSTKFFTEMLMSGPYFNDWPVNIVRNCNTLLRV